MSKKDKVSADMIYQEIFQEMRRFRDYELNSSSWYTTILLTLLGFVITVKYGGVYFVDLSKILNEEIWAQCLFSFVITVIGWCSACSVRYASTRYHELKDHLFSERNKKKLSALSWKEFQPARRTIYPVRFIYFIHYAILLISNSIIFLPRGWWAILFVNTVVSIAFASIFLYFFPRNRV